MRNGPEPDFPGAARRFNLNGVPRLMEHGGTLWMGVPPPPARGGEPIVVPDRDAGRRNARNETGLHTGVCADGTWRPVLCRGGGWGRFVRVKRLGASMPVKIIAPLVGSTEGEADAMIVQSVSVPGGVHVKRWAEICWLWESGRWAPRCERA